MAESLIEVGLFNPKYPVDSTSMNQETWWKTMMECCLHARKKPPRINSAAITLYNQR